MNPEADERIESWVWRIAGIVIVGSIMSILDTTIVNVALSRLGSELHTSIANIQWVVTGYLLSLAVLELLRASLWILIGAVFIQAILSWVAPDGPLAGVLNALTFRVLAPIRRVIPPLGGSLDLSPLIVIVLAQLALILPLAWLEQSLARLFQ